MNSGFRAGDAACMARTLGADLRLIRRGELMVAVSEPGGLQHVEDGGPHQPRCQQGKGRTQESCPCA